MNSKIFIPYYLHIKKTGRSKKYQFIGISIHSFISHLSVKNLSARYGPQVVPCKICTKGSVQTYLVKGGYHGTTYNHLNRSYWWLVSYVGTGVGKDD